MLITTPSFLRSAILWFLIMAFTGALYAGTAPSPGASLPVPTGTWTMALTAGLPPATNDWEQLVYVPPLQRSVMLSMYHQNNSEPNESLVGYNFDTNSWDVLEMGGNFHTEYMPEGGESVGYFDFNPNDNAIEYHCCTSGSNQVEDMNHTWWFDVLGQSGRDKQTPVEPPPIALQPGGVFDAAHDVFVLYGGASYIGTWLYNPVANSWGPITAAGTPPDPSVILPGAAYSSKAQQVFLFGGRGGSGAYLNDLYYYDVPSNTWTLVSPVGGVKPPARCCTNFAYDSTNNIFLLYGGKNSSGILGDTWVYDPAANTWTQLTPPQSPAINTVSDFTKLAYDSDHNVFVLAHIGSGGYFGGNWSTLAMQTWLFRYAGTGPNAGTLINTTQPAPGSVSRNLAGWSSEPAIAASGNSLDLAWTETGSPFDTTTRGWPHIYADQYLSGSWAPLGQSYISSPSGEEHAPSLAIIGGTPWTSWYQSNVRVFEVYAASWNGSSWQNNIPIGLVSSAATQGHSQLADVGGIPYIAFIEINKTASPQSGYAYVKTWNGTSWSLVGSSMLNHNSSTGSTATSISIASDGTSPYVAWTEYLRTSNAHGALVSTNPQVYVSHWNGGSWVPLGASINVSPTAGWANDASVAYFNGQPYVAWTERTQTGNNQLYVATWNGTSWVLTGSGSLNVGGASGWAYRPSLVADPVGNNLYVGWVEQTAFGQKAKAFVAQYANGVWSILGGGSLNLDPLNGSAERIRLAIYQGEPVASWAEVNLGSVRKVYVAQWNGSAWTQLAGDGGGTDTTRPSTPTGLSAVPVSSSQINLAWYRSTDTVGVTGYKVYRDGSQIATVTSTFNYQDTGLVPSSTHTYKVAAYDAAGNVSAQSSSATATTPGTSTTPPTVSITAPANAATVTGTITVTANATDSVAMSGVQFQLDGANLGSFVSGPGPNYSISWNTTAASNGSHTISAVATDTSSLSSTATISVTVNNPPPPEPVISGVSSSSITSTGATILWTTDEASSSQVAYGTTTAYGSTTPVDATMVTSHSVALSGLTPSTLYHYQVISQDASSNTNSSTDHTFTTAPAGLQTLLQINGNTAEVSGTSNGSLVTPTVAPSGFTGNVVAKGTGSVNFFPVQAGNGVYFLLCCYNTNAAYFKFTGSALGNIFNVNQGQISFVLQSRYSFSQRQASAASPRYSFDVRDGNGAHLFYFLTEVVSSRLQFAYQIAGKAQTYYVPQGTEDTLFGSGVDLPVSITWNAGAGKLYLNNNLVQSFSYTAPTPNWSAGSNFDLGAYEYLGYGGYNALDDAIAGFSVAGP